ncbi:hypothetical protein JKP88DRAFT_262983 [Tribonema minus]|uniref:Uncharacterized protein n=1 Tax=Tribonema minus TaxID=303371 RepID=A0A835Z7N3_9STRA|nr:hypothetical protein JKP88DRAFT_262983 [Tribonema minus]
MAMIWSPDRVAMAVENSGIGCWWWHCETGEIGWNSHMYTLFDKAPSSDPISLSHVLHTIQRVLRVLHRDCSIITIMAEGNSVDGSRKMTGICVDITDLAVKTSHWSGTASEQHSMSQP